jgi:hypothetical protein
LIISRRSPRTGKINNLEIDINDDQVAELIARSRPIQQICPNLTPDEREFLLTGYTKEDWAAIFPPEEEDGSPESVPGHDRG